MPELPEVEVVRRGLDRWVPGRVIESVEVLTLRSVRRHLGGPHDFADALVGRSVASVERRGKFLWFALAEPTADARGSDDETSDDRSGSDVVAEALLAHLGMSGQLLMQPREELDEKHLRVRIRFADGGRELRFVDQRTFGGLAVEAVDLDPVTARPVPMPVLHIAPDPLEPAFDVARMAAALRRRRTGIKRALLDQTLVSGIGNIYADEALWRARFHYARPTAAFTNAQVRELVDHVREVMEQALAQGGTSFDSLYVDVNGSSGYFERSLEVYGREGEPCRRCGRPVVREPFMNRSSYRCPRCQRVPRGAHW